jgi:hypothetical protein
VHRYVALSRDLAGYLERRWASRRSASPDLQRRRRRRFCPCPRAAAPIAGCPFGGPRHWLVGTVGRMQGVKDQTLLARAFVRRWRCARAARAGCAW